MGQIVTAEYRARRFLLDHLNWWQRLTLRIRGGFRVKGNSTRRHYWVNSRGVTRGLTFYCLIVYDGKWQEVPYYDAMLAKKILIGAAEPLFLKTAKKR